MKQLLIVIWQPHNLFVYQVQANEKIAKALQDLAKSSYVSIHAVSSIFQEVESSRMISHRQVQVLELKGDTTAIFFTCF